MVQGRDDPTRPGLADMFDRDRILRPEPAPALQHGSPPYVGQNTRNHPQIKPYRVAAAHKKMI
jgi:hypothetical protein